MALSRNKASSLLQQLLRQHEQAFARHHPSLFRSPLQALLQRDLDGVFSQQRDFTKDLPKLDSRPDRYHSHYSSSWGSMTGPDGQTRQYSREKYRDSAGRSRELTERQLGDQKFSAEQTGDAPPTRRLENLEEADIAEFEKAFEWWNRHAKQDALNKDIEGLKTHAAEAEKPHWNDSLVNELREYGFHDQQAARDALTESQGDIKAAVKALVEKERLSHGKH